MQTRIVKITQENQERQLREAAAILQNGGLVAFPTETVYGLGANGLDGTAAEKIYAAKGRPSDNPLILHIAENEQLLALVRQIDARARALMEAFWPGPLTMIFPKSDIVPYEVTGGLDTVAVRMPSHPVAAAMLRAVRLPVAAPSANLSGRPSPTSAAHVIEDMEGRIDMILDGGDVGLGVESTIIDLTGEHPVLLRPGYVTKEMMERVLGEIEIDRAVCEQVGADVRPRAPGMKYRHYAPKAGMVLVEGQEDEVVSYINSQTETMRRQGKRVGVMAADESRKRYRADVVLSAGSRQSADSIAHNLFRVLREFDREGVDFIFSESFSEEGTGFAVMNRLHKAAGYRIVKLP